MHAFRYLPVPLFELGPWFSTCRQNRIGPGVNPLSASFKPELKLLFLFEADQVDDELKFTPSCFFVKGIIPRGFVRRQVHSELVSKMKNGLDAIVQPI